MIPSKTLQNQDIAELLFPNVEKEVSYYELKFPRRNLEGNAKVTRFAPSPTGFVHVGDIYAALISKLLARKEEGGVFFLRIEDTDKKRETPGGIKDIVDSLNSFGIYPDEGYVEENKAIGSYGPYKQSERMEIYHAFAKEMVKRGMAYPCFCTPEELDEIRKIQEAKKVKPGYYGDWAVHRNDTFEQITKNLIKSGSFALRLKTPKNEGAKIKCDDIIKGEVEFPENDVDIVLIKSDGLPTYHFAHFVDDYLMRVTHVIRGDEWLSSLPVHLQIFKMFGVKPPKYGHIAPIVKIIGKSKRKLSKRKDPEAAVSYYYTRGYPTEGVIEYLLNLANSNLSEWRKGHPNEKLESFPFNIKKMGNSWATFDLDKLNFISKNTIAGMDFKDVFASIKEWAKNYDPNFYSTIMADEKYTENVLNIENSGTKGRKDFSSWSDFRDNFDYFFDELAQKQNITNFQFPEDVSVREREVIINNFNENYSEKDTKDVWLEKFRNFFVKMGYAPDTKTYIQNENLYKGHIGLPFMTLRVALTGKTKTPDLFEVMHVMGVERVKQRLGRFLNNNNNKRNLDASFSITPELRSIATKAFCNFLDYRTTSKEHVRNYLDSNQETVSNPHKESFVISTCLRYEIFGFGEEYQETDNFHTSKGKLAVRRLISLAAGLQSEIIGEQEIFGQIKAAIDNALANDLLSLSTYKALQNILSLGEKIRETYDLNTNENYSTIGADILDDKTEWDKRPVVMIIGGGYMANSFLKKISKKVTKLIWVNRSLDKLKKQSDLFEDISKESIIFSNTEEAIQYFPIVDIIFSAVSNSPFNFGENEIKKLTKDCKIIDVSYPPIFSAVEGVDVMNIANTYFDRLVKNVVPKTKIISANEKIDELVERIFNNGTNNK